MEKLKIEYVDINSIKPYKKNAKLHPQEQIEQIKKSIEKFGMDDPIGIWKDEIVEGHGRLIACKQLGYEEVPIIRLDHLTDEERKAYTLAHNKLTMNSDFDIDILNDELMNFDTIDMSDFGFDLDLGMEKEQEIIEDEVPDVPEEPKAKLGDIYQLGNHRLMCGDSTSKEDVNKLVGNQKMDLLITDPPYNVEIVGGNHSESPAERKKKGNLTIQNDKMDNDSFQQFLLSAFTNAYSVLKDGASFYCWYASREVVNFHTAIEKAGFTVKQELIWNKSSLVMGRQDYQWKHEPCLYGWKETDSHIWYGDRKQTTVIDWDRPTKADLHPTMKPIGLFDYQIKNSSKTGDNILDLFGGSGTTLMACEQNNRNAFIMEYDPKYVDVIIQRWENFTGQKAVKLN
jgi:site-specific DNA-methyltransferase (adenine-specific)